jgi:methylmalonyl-CoA/ethylmalonyl-CoA epimerase
MSKVIRIDHIAIVVDDMEKTLAFWRDALGIEVARIEDVPAEYSKVAFLPLGDGDIELVQPTMSGLGLKRFLERRGPGMHHVCLEVDDIDGMLARLKTKGIQLINPEALSGSGGKKYAFIHPKSANGVLVELYELPNR